MKSISRPKLIQAVLIALFLFALYSNIRLIIRNQEINQRLKKAKAETAALELSTKKFKLLIDYYKTPSYQEIEARRRLGLKKPDETVLVVKGLPENTNLGEGLTDEIYQDTAPAAPRAQTNLSKWWQYFFGN